MTIKIKIPFLILSQILKKLKNRPYYDNCIEIKVMEKTPATEFAI